MSRLRLLEQCGFTLICLFSLDGCAVITLGSWKNYREPVPQDGMRDQLHFCLRNCSQNINDRSRMLVHLVDGDRGDIDMLLVRNVRFSFIMTVT